MSLFDRFGSQHDGQATGFEALAIDSALQETIQAPYERSGLTVRPHKDNGGIEAMDDVLESLHTVETKSPRLSRTTKNVSPAHAFEMRYAAPSPADERVVSLQYLAGDDSLAGTLERQLQTQYPQSQVETNDTPMFLHADTGQYIAGATLGLRRYTLLPIKNIDLPGFRTDPTGSVLEEMVGAQQDDVADADVIVQIMFKPAQRDWTEGVSGGLGELDGDDTNVKDGISIRDLAFNLRQPSYEMRRRVFSREKIEHPPSKVDKQVATLLEEQQGEKGWRLCFRVFAISDDPDIATSRASKVAGMFRNFYESNTEQTFIPNPLRGDELREQVQLGVAREFHDTGMVKSQREIAGLVNVPEAQYVNTNKMQWSLSRPGEGVPVGTPRFDFDAVDLPDVPTKAEKQVAMLDHSTPDDPFWFGFGRKNGTEVGIYEEYLNAHMMVTGGTRKGKTTTLTNFASQVYNREYGALIIVNGKEQDEDRFIEEWPADRPEEDFVFIDTGDAFDKQVRFNLLEVPTDADPGTNAFESAVYSLADDWAATFAEAGGGSDNYWGALMERITRTVIVGLAKSGKTCTPMDIAAAVSSKEQMEKFSQWMDDERIHFVREAARRAAEKDDADLEPLAGRMDYLTQHAGLRNFMSARDPTASIQNFVNDGKVCVLRIDPALSESETKFLLTPFVRRFYTAVRTVDDAPRFYLIWDEFDKAVSPRTNIHEMLSIAGGNGFRMVLACQSPSNQLYDKLKHALQNQVDTAISFGTGKKDARYIQSHHSFDDPSDLSGIGRYKFWLRTYYKTADDEDKTYSYKVDAFPPVRETRQRVLGDDYEVDVEGMKRRSVERYGDIPQTAEQLKAESDFYRDPADGTAPARPATGDTNDDVWRDQALKAIYDETIRNGDPGGWVSLADCVDRLDRYLPKTEVTDHGKAYRRVIQQLPDPYIAEREIEEDDDWEVKPLDMSFLNVGDSENDGDAAHKAPMADAYIPMTQLGFIFEIPEQTTGVMPDGFARTDDMLAITPDDDNAQIAEKVNSYRKHHKLPNRLAGTKDAYIESEHTTGSSQPSQTVKNLAQAHNAGHRCLFFVREDVAPKVYDTVAHESIYCHSTHPVETERRFHTGTQPLKIDGTTMTRPGTRDNVWVHDEQTGEYSLRDTDGTVHARFDSAADIFTDASAYPDGGERNIMPPVIPEYEIDGDLHEVEWDVIVVPVPETNEDDEKIPLTPMDLRLYEDGKQTPLLDLLTANTNEEDTSDSTPPESQPVDDHNEENSVSFNRF